MRQRSFTRQKLSELHRLSVRPIFDWLRELKHKELTLGLSIFVLSMFMGWILSLCYPDGITNQETKGYWWISTDFHLLAPNLYDWVRTIPYGVVLRICSQFPHPTHVIYWINTSMFSVSAALVLVLGRLLFASLAAGFGLAMSLLVFEFVCMRLFFHNLHATADPFFAELVHLGILLTLIGWLRPARVLFIFGYAILGLAAFTKPVGLSFLPVWSLFGCYVFWTNNGKSLGKLVITVSIILLWCPSLLWSLRNDYIYGPSETLGNFGFSMLQAVFPLMSDQDQLLDDPSANANFKAAVRATERENKIKWADNTPALTRQEWYDCYFGIGNEPSIPLVLLTKMADPHWTDKKPGSGWDSKEMHKVDAIAGKLAWKIIRAHPQEFFHRFKVEYVTMFSPLHLPPMEWESYKSDPEIAYRERDIGDFEPNFFLYPRCGRPLATASNKSLAHGLGNFLYNQSIQAALRLYYANQFWLPHLIFLGALVSFVWATANRRQIGQRTNIDQIAVVLVMLFVTTAFDYATVSLCQVARLRYAIAGGDIELHLMFLIALYKIFEVNSKDREEPA